MNAAFLLYYYKLYTVGNKSNIQNDTAFRLCSILEQPEIAILPTGPENWIGPEGIASVGSSLRYARMVDCCKSELV